MIGAGGLGSQLRKRFVIDGLRVIIAGRARAAIDLLAQDIARERTCRRLVPSSDIEIRRVAFGLAIPAKIPAKAEGCSGLLLVFSIRRDNFLVKSGIEPAT